MENQLQSVDLLGAELLCGYNYFSAQDHLSNRKQHQQQLLSQQQDKLKELKTDLEQAKRQIPANYDVDEVVNHPVFIARYEQDKKTHADNFPKYFDVEQRKYQAVCQSKELDRKGRLEKAIQQNKEIDKENAIAKRKRTLSTLSVVGSVSLIILAIMGIVVGALTKDRSDILVAWLICSALGIVPAIILCISVISNVVIESKSGDFKIKPHLPTSSLEKPTQFVPLDEQQCKEKYLKQFAHTPKKYFRVISQKWNVLEPLLRVIFADQIAQNIAVAQAKVEEQNQKIATQQQVIALIQKQQEWLTAEGKQIVRDLVEIPAYYFQQDSIVQMLFFFLNKRANNVTDLINLYEQKIFQDKLVHAVQSIKISIDNLTTVINRNFARLGSQLGVINESINENTSQLILNRTKLNSIQDDMSKKYLTTVNHINNVKQIVEKHHEWEQSNPTTVNVTVTTGSI